MIDVIQRKLLYMEAADSLCCQSVASGRPGFIAPGTRLLRQSSYGVYTVQLLGRGTPVWLRNILSVHIFAIRCEVIQC